MQMLTKYYGENLGSYLVKMEAKVDNEIFHNIMYSNTIGTGCFNFM